MLNKGADSGLHWRADRVLRHGYFHARGCPYIDTMIGKTFIPSLDTLAVFIIRLFCCFVPPKSPRIDSIEAKKSNFF